MRKIYAGAFLFFSSLGYTYANPGDTTIIQAHNLTQLSWYDNYDTPVTFPDGSKTYSKVILEFTLGKYACPGYDPNNPGEGTNQTGWCADWDYDVHIMACKPGGDTMELARMITPYANSNFPRTPAAWSHPYVFDVTDYYPLLQNDVTMRIFYSGYSGGFTGSVKFYFIEGTPPRNVVGISNLWQGGFAYGNSTDPIEAKIAAKTLTMPATAQSAEMKVIITGHGGDNTSNCAEFCKKWYQFKVNGSLVEQKDIWRDNCASNFLYPQSGTWVYDRGNWCPGDLVHENIHKVPGAVAPGSSFTTDLDFQTYNSGNNGASYKVAAGMFFYGAFNNQTDAGIEAIISPNNDETHYRNNPVCGSPVVNVKNFGGNAINSIKFEYGIEGQTLSAYTHTFTAPLSSLSSSDVSLPALPALNTVTGNNNKFVVHILEVNNTTDQNIYNNNRTVAFTAAPDWLGGNFVVNLKMSSSVSGVNTTTWKVIDVSTGAVVKENTGTQSSSSNNAVILSDTLALANGCYKLQVSTPKNRGLAFFNTIPIRGYVRVTNLSDGNLLPLPKTDLGIAGLEGNFGSGFEQYFRVANSTGVNNVNKTSYSLNVYPNPANNVINVSIYGTVLSEAKVQLVNIMGQVVYTTSTRNQQISIPTEHLANGIYTLVYNTGDSRKMEKVVISK